MTIALSKYLQVQKWIVVISLLQGEIPERSVFRVPIHRKTLAPYLELTQGFNFSLQVWTESSYKCQIYFVL